MDKLNQGDKDPGTNRTVVTTTLSSSAVVPTATVSSSTPACTQVPSTSLSIVPPQRQTVQVIRQTIHRPPTMAAQYLQQMYAAQRQHLMLQTAALQQQQTPHLQSLATIQQASIIGRRATSSLPSSVDGIVSQPPGVPPHSIPVTAQLISRTQGSSSTAVGGSISQQAMLLGNRPQHCTQAQMYLRTQMLILTPAATVAAVQSDLPAVSSCSSQTASSQVQGLALDAHLPGALAAAHAVLLKPSCQSQALASAPTLPKMAICPLKVSQQTNRTDTGAKAPDHTQLTKEPHIKTPATGSPVQSHPPVKQQLSCPPNQQGTNHQLILHQAAGRSVGHRQLQPIALRAAHQETSCNPLSLSFKPLTLTQTHTSVNPTDPLSSCLATSTPATTVQPQPPPLVAAPQRRTSHPLSHSQPPPPPPPLVLPRLPRNPPASLQRLSLHSAQALAVQSGHVLTSEAEMPVAEALIQMPYQHLSPPQTVAVDLKVHLVRHTEAVPSTQTCNVNGLSSREKKEEHFPSPERDNTTSTPPSRSPRENSTAGIVLSCVASSHSEVRPAGVEPARVARDNSPHRSPPRPPTLPPPTFLAAVRGLGPPPSSTASLPGSPDGLLRPHILTHLIEGFVVREGLEPFPVGPPSLSEDQQTSLPESQERLTNGDAASDDSAVDAEPSDSSDSEMENDAAEEPRESVTDVLQCEFCGIRGYAHTFLRSKRFCSMTCVRRFNVSCTKRISTLRADRAAHWGLRPTGRRGRPPRRVNGASREHFLRQAKCSSGSEVTLRGSLRKEEDEEEEDGSPVPMTTRRRQAEREREREREQRVVETTGGLDREEEGVSKPSQWNVEQVFAFISSLPGGRDVARDFRSQEIDGQALLLLTEDHLVSTMNLKLGPALKLCAHINSLKEP